MADISSIKLPSGTAYDIKDATARDDISNLATVGTSGSYTDLTNKPTIPTAMTQQEVYDAVDEGFIISGGYILSDANGESF